MSDAKALEMQVRQSVGQPVRPEAEADEELKLLALQGLQHSDPEQAVPMLEKILQGTQSPRLKERALFVLAQSNSPARAPGADHASRAAARIRTCSAAPFSISASTAVARTATCWRRSTNRPPTSTSSAASCGPLACPANARVSRGRDQGDAPRSCAPKPCSSSASWARTTSSGSSIRKKPTVAVKKQILQAMFVGGNATRLIELANTETDPELRRAAIRNLGLMGARRTADALVAIYGREKDSETKKAVIQALVNQNNAEQLVAIARKETDPQMRKEIVSRLSHMRSKVALDYLMEILNK